MVSTFSGHRRSDTHERADEHDAETEHGTRYAWHSFFPYETFTFFWCGRLEVKLDPRKTKIAHGGNNIRHKRSGCSSYQLQDYPEIAGE